MTPPREPAWVGGAVVQPQPPSPRDPAHAGGAVVQPRPPSPRDRGSWPTLPSPRDPAPIAEPPAQGASRVSVLADGRSVRAASRDIDQAEGRRRSSLGRAQPAELLECSDLTGTGQLLQSRRTSEAGLGSFVLEGQA